MLALARHIGFDPTALKCCVGITFTHGIQIGGQVFWRMLAKAYMDCISETLKYKIWILDRDIASGM